ncbi:hypothetical protein HXX76_014105 [Chlamydomonas incerta]|uniref:SMODS and SLOG-associating 2TM effector domain-containing protein n=1 Tax=Chlamydomonas incerta TaxID=51695 RepID=A0A835VQ04_CHLIN|nr:hypothetical protein HXX76_014105 [Chlamydomonas incerta]|eukprot:KAG2424947.1 hypothetical protein HXX76_014105 [Chlamydomonas incerta]
MRRHVLAPHGPKGDKPIVSAGGTPIRKRRLPPRASASEANLRLRHKAAATADKGSSPKNSPMRDQPTPAHVFKMLSSPLLYPGNRQQRLEEQARVVRQIELDEDRLAAIYRAGTQLQEEEIEPAYSEMQAPSPLPLPRPTHSAISINAEGKMEQKQRLLQEWVHRAQGLAWMHRRSYGHFRAVSIAIMLPTIVLSTVSGATNLILSNSGGGDSCDKSNSIVPSAMATGITSLMSAAMSTIYHFLDLGSRQKEHEDSATDLEKLAREITVHLLLGDTQERTFVNLAEFIKSTREKYDTLTDSMPHIPHFIAREYNRNKDKIQRKAGCELSNIVINEASSMRLDP